MKIKEFFKKHFTIKKGSETYLTKYPDITTRKQLADFINKKTEQENAQLKARELKRKEEDQEQIKQLEEIKKEEIIEEKVRAHLKQEETLKKQRAIKLRIEGLNIPPTFFLKSNVPYYKFMGVYLQETKEGGLLWYPWLRKTVDKKAQDFLFDCPASNFKEFFKQTVGIVSQMRGGKLDSNFDIDENKQPALYSKDITEDKKGKKYEVIHLEDAERQKLEKEAKLWEDKFYNILNELNESNKIIKRMEGKTAEQEVSTEMAIEDADISRSNLSVLANKQMGMVQEFGNLLSSAQDREMRQILSQRMNKSLIDAIDKTNTFLDEKFPDKPVLREEIKSFVQIAIKEARPQPIVVQPAAPASTTP